MKTIEARELKNGDVICIPASTQTRAKRLLVVGTPEVNGVLVNFKYLTKKGGEPSVGQFGAAVDLDIDDEPMPVKYALSEYTTQELSVMRESNQKHIDELEAFNKRVKDLGTDMEKLAKERTEKNYKTLAILYDQRVHVLTAFQSVQRIEKAISN